MPHIFFRRLERRRSTQAIFPNNFAQGILGGCPNMDPPGIDYGFSSRINPAWSQQLQNFSTQTMVPSQTFGMTGNYGMPAGQYGMPYGGGYGMPTGQYGTSGSYLMQGSMMGGNYGMMGMYGMSPFSNYGVPSQTFGASKYGSWGAPTYQANFNPSLSQVLCPSVGCPSMDPVGVESVVGTIIQPRSLGDYRNPVYSQTGFGSILQNFGRR